MARIEIKGEQHTVGEVFSERYAFLVPPYQRPYAWTTEHAGELLDDLLGYLGEGAEPVEELSPYFLGVSCSSRASDRRLRSSMDNSG